MTGQTLIIALAVAPAVVVLVWTVVDCRRYNAAPTAHLFDQDGRLIGATDELPLYQGGRHRRSR
jgi:hypothetical protein